MRSLVALSLLALTAAAIAEEAPVSDFPGIKHGLIGHPRERFPLTIFAEPAPTGSMNSAIRDAVAQWNEVFEQVFHRAAFTWTPDKADADIFDPIREIVACSS